MAWASAGIDISAIWTAAGIVVGFSVGAFGFRLKDREWSVDHA